MTPRVIVVCVCVCLCILSLLTWMGYSAVFVLWIDSTQGSNFKLSVKASLLNKSEQKLTARWARCTRGFDSRLFIHTYTTCGPLPGLVRFK